MHIPHKLELCVLLHLQHQLQVLLFYPKNKEIGQPVSRGNRQGHWKFRTWFLSFSICLLLDFLGLNNIFVTFCQKDRMLCRSGSQLIVEAMLPYLLHILPVLNNTMLNRVMNFEYSFFCYCFLPNIYLFRIEAMHPLLILRCSNYCRKWGGRCIIAGKSSFTHSWTVVDNNRCAFFLWHLVTFAINFADGLTKNSI